MQWSHTTHLLGLCSMTPEEGSPLTRGKGLIFDDAEFIAVSPEFICQDVYFVRKVVNLFLVVILFAGDKNLNNIMQQLYHCAIQTHGQGF